MLGVPRSWAATLLAALMLASGAVLPGRVAGSVPPPRVAIIVGPTGPGFIDRYRALAAAAAAVARTITPDVVTVDSPDATWDAVRAAADGASVLVYLGHGNGWPSRYSSALVPATQDGFGLNPSAGSGDAAHQYYGEAYVRRLRLAPGAVVLLHHLCYASGSTEPGLPDGRFDAVLQRADNFAAGFLAAGASTVIAEGHADPASLMMAALAGPTAVRAAWSRAAWGHGHVASYPSLRNPGATVTLDPDTIASDKTGTGWYRAMTVASEAATRPPAITPAAVGPVSLSASGVSFGLGSVSGPVMPSAPLAITLPASGSGAALLPPALGVGVRYVPLSSPASPDGTASSADGLEVGDAASDVVAAAQANVTGGGLVIHGTAPAQPGIYLALLTLEAPDGTPYDAATQALLRPVVFRVPPPVEATITAPAALVSAPGQQLAMQVDVANTGTQAWGSPLYAGLWSDPSPQPWLAEWLGSVLSLHAAWLDADTGDSSDGASAALPRQLGDVGGSARVGLQLVTPRAPGRWLLVLSVATEGSLGTYPSATLVVPVEVR